MNVSCKDRERIFEDGTAAEWSSLEAHAVTCASCAEELRSWKSLSSAAAELRDYAVGSALWPRIHKSLVEQAGKIEERQQGWNWRSLLASLSASWQTAAATAFVIVLMVAGGWFLRSPRNTEPGSLLKSKALVGVEHAESAYVQAIDKLAVEAKPQLENPATPLMANYREKLMVLDSAIDDLRSQTGQNPSNAHLRYQLLAMYQEKQRTLEEILEEKR
jgi:anti-sigma-K factor RskA